MSNTPLTPADCDLRDFAHIQLDVARLRNSDMALTESPEACWAAVLLWCASWHQIPAASLPDDDLILSNLAGYGRVVKEWKKVKQGALHGWIKCDDGRLYHPVVAEKACDAWGSKMEHHYSRMTDRVRKANKAREEKKLPAIEIPSLEQWLQSGRADPVLTPSAGIPPETSTPSAGIPPETSTPSAGIPPENTLKGEGEGEGEGIKEEANASVAGGDVMPACDVQAIIDLYHEALPELPAVRLLSDQRRKAARGFWRWVLTSKKSDGSHRAKTADQALTWIRAYFARANHNDFLMGRHGASGAHAGWRADFDFLLTERGRKHVIEKTEVAA